MSALKKYDVTITKIKCVSIKSDEVKHLPVAVPTVSFQQMALTKVAAFAVVVKNWLEKTGHACKINEMQEYTATGIINTLGKHDYTKYEVRFVISLNQQRKPVRIK